MSIYWQMCPTCRGSGWNGWTTIHPDGTVEDQNCERCGGYFHKGLIPERGGLIEEDPCHCDQCKVDGGHLRSCSVHNANGGAMIYGCDCGNWLDARNGRVTAAGVI